MMKRLLFLLFVFAGCLDAQVVLPTLPQATVNLALPTQGASACPTLTTGSNCIRTPASGSASDFQSAINAATCGDTIVLAENSTYSGNFTIPSTACSGWIEIVSSGLSHLPVQGRRVATSDLVNMAVISTPNNAPALAFLPSSNHWRIIGCEITTSFASASTLSSMVLMGYQSDNNTAITVASQLPNQIIFDRTYMYGSASTPIQHGFSANTQSFALVDSYCDEIIDNAADSQCVLSYNGTGPFLIQNNFLQAESEDILFGGADPAIANLVPSDITIQGNQIQKNVAAWMGVLTNVKNLVEFKNGQRVLIDGNVIQYTWFSQQYEAVLLRSVNQDGGCTWCVVRDVTVTHNIIRHAPMGLQIAPFESSDAIPTQRILVQNNQFSDISNATWGHRGWTFEISANAPPNAHDFTLSHNTTFSDVASLEMDYDNPGSQITGLQVTDNLEDSGSSGVLTQDSASVSSFVNGPFLWNKFAQMNPTSTPVGQQPTGTSFTSIAGAGFTSTSGTDPNLAGNFQLAANSPYHNAGTDGKDVGVWDWATLNAETTAALNGTFPTSVTPIVFSGGVSFSGGITVQ